MADAAEATLDAGTAEPIEEHTFDDELDKLYDDSLAKAEAKEAEAAPPAEPTAEAAKPADPNKPAAEQPEPAAEEITAPTSWPADQIEKFNALPQEQKVFLRGMASGMNADYTQKMQAIAPLRQTFERYSGYAQQKARHPNCSLTR